jgi:hypothetical protein
VSVGLNWRRELVVPTEEPPGPLVSMTTMRATPIRIGGVTPSIRFKAESEPEDFTLGVGIEVARNAGGHLYREVEIVAEIHRGWDGAIWDGELLEVREIQEVDAGEAWRSWFQRCLREWDDVDDVDAKLRQDGGGDGE